MVFSVPKIPWNSCVWGVTMLTSVAEWFRMYEFIAVWLEAIALILLFGLDWLESRSQGKERKLQEEERRSLHEETAAQMEIWRKQLHSDRVVEIFQTLRKFHNFIIRGVYFDKTVGPGKDFSDTGDYSNKGGNVFPEYLELQEAFYLSRLVSEPLYAFMKERMGDADGLQRIADPVTFNQRLQEFNHKWDVYKMAEKIRELS
jgi:hypothetical protein